eukprot:7851904-Pyramimonas_sp.AAC.1
MTRRRTWNSEPIPTHVPDEEGKGEQERASKWEGKWCEAVLGAPAALQPHPTARPALGSDEHTKNIATHRG